jgi:hypothetical protein
MKNWLIDQFRTERANQFWTLLKTIVINNLVLFAFDLVIDGICLFLPLLYLPLLDSTFSIKNIIISVLVYLTPLVLYMIAGYLLKPTKYIFTDFFSVILFGLIGVTIWVDCMNRPTSNALNSSWWGYGFYTAGMGVYGLLISENDNYNYWRILYSIIPVLLSFCGLEIKRINNKKEFDFIKILKHIFKK